MKIWTKFIKSKWWIKTLTIIGILVLYNILYPFIYLLVAPKAKNKYVEYDPYKIMGFMISYRGLYDELEPELYIMIDDTCKEYDLDTALMVAIGLAATELNPNLEERLLGGKGIFRVQYKMYDTYKRFNNHMDIPEFNRMDDTTWMTEIACWYMKNITLEEIGIPVIKHICYYFDVDEYRNKDDNYQVVKSIYKELKKYRIK